MSIIATSKGDLIKNLAKSTSVMNDEIQALEDEYGAAKLEKIEYVAPTDDELLAVAKATLKEKYDLKRDDATSSSNSKKKSLSQSIEDLLKDAQAKKDNADLNYSNAIKDVENQAVKRGIARSSIALSALSNLADDNANAKASIDKDSQDKKDDILKQIQDVEETLQTTLNKLDEDQNVEVDKELNELKEERDKKVEEVTKFNNQVAEKERAYIASGGLADVQPLVNDIRVREMLKMTGMVLDYFASLDDREKAIEELENDEVIKEYLGNYHQYAVKTLKHSTK